MREELTPAQRLTKLKKEIEGILDGGIVQFLTPWANTKKPIYIYIQGYTPSFNDGEPCLHSSQEYSKEEIDEVFEYNLDIFGNLTLEEILESEPWPKGLEFREALLAVHEALEYKYDTDYQVLITLKDGQVSYVKDHYDVGY
jgi:hypothetical protein